MTVDNRAQTAAPTGVQPQEKTAKVTRIKWSMVAAGIVLGLAAFFLFPDSLSLEGRGVVGIGVVMAFWWMTEAVPIEATSLLPLILFPVTGIAPIGEAAAPYANSVIYLVLGGIVLGLATQRWNLHRRVALLIILAVGTKPSQIVFGLMLASAFITMWVSNTATAVIMVPIGGAILALINSLEGSKVTPKLAASMLLGIAYSVTIGSMATLIGQPPMALMKAYLGDNYNIEIGFGQWMLVGVPFAAFMMFASWLVLTKLVFRSEVQEIPGGKEIMRAELTKLGGLTTQEKRVIAIFLGAAFCWIFMPFIAEIPAVAAAAPFLANFNDTSIAITAALLCFIVPGDKVSNGPLLEWSATKEVPWGLLILFGGGLSLSDQFTSTGLSEWIGDSVGGLAGVPTLLLMVIAIILLVILTELTSNTATAAAFLPIMTAVGVGLGIDPLVMAIAVTLAVSGSYMLPVGTPSNAVAFAVGDVSMRNMMRGGLWLNIISIVTIPVVLLTLVPLVFGVGL
jgi:solute carrier family 13 (sodium-dependent dicarboxylate transporter), member 2/3/5